MEHIKNILKENKLKIFLFLCLSVFTSLLGVGLLAFINNYLLQSKDMVNLLYFGVLLVSFFALNLFVEFSLARFGQNFIYIMQRKIVKQILDTPLLKLQHIGKARILASLGNDVRTISFGLLGFPDFVQSSILVIATSVYLYSLSPSIFALCGAVVLVLFSINYFFMVRSFAYFRKSRDKDDALMRNYKVILDGRKELSLNAHRAKLYYEKNFQKNVLDKRYANIMNAFMQSLSRNFTSVGFLALVGLEFYFALAFELTSISNATTIAIAILFLRAPLISIMGSIPTLLMAKVALDKVQSLELIEYKNEFELATMQKQWHKISFDKVAFSYNDKFALKPTTLEIYRGELVFLIGKNGSGKSTFSQLLAGLILPNEGEIYLDEMKIDEGNIAWYRSHISAIFSDFYLFTQAIKEDKIADKKEISKWLEVLELSEKTQVENGELTTTKLSTGQRKRLAMFISLLEDRSLLILDEFAADQDPVFRRFFYKKLLPMLQNLGKTIVVISHDDMYFDMADRIFLAQNGVIKELFGEDKKILAKEAVERF